MDTYEYPVGVTFRASTPEHAAARVLGGKPSDYLATIRPYPSGGLYAEVTTADGSEWVEDIPMVEEV